MKKKSRIVGIVMLLIAIIFLIFAFNNPQASFSWNIIVTYIIYSIYLIFMILFLIAPFNKK